MKASRSCCVSVRIGAGVTSLESLTVTRTIRLADHHINRKVASKQHLHLTTDSHNDVVRAQYIPAS